MLPVIHDALGLCLKDKTTLSDASTKSIRKFSLSLSTENTKSIRGAFKNYLADFVC